VKIIRNLKALHLIFS